MSNVAHKHAIRYQPVWNFLMSLSASQICPKLDQKQQGSALCIDARVWCFRVLVSFRLRQENLTQISACTMQLAFHYARRTNRPNMPKPQFYPEPNDHALLHCSAGSKDQGDPQQGHFVSLCTCVWPNIIEDRLPDFWWHVSFGGGSQDEYRARSRPRSCKVKKMTFPDSIKRGPKPKQCYVNPLHVSVGNDLEFQFPTNKTRTCSPNLQVPV